MELGDGDLVVDHGPGIAEPAVNVRIPQQLVDALVGQPEFLVADLRFNGTEIPVQDVRVRVRARVQRVFHAKAGPDAGLAAVALFVHQVDLEARGIVVVALPHQLEALGYGGDANGAVARHRCLHIQRVRLHRAALAAGVAGERPALLVVVVLVAVVEVLQDGAAEIDIDVLAHALGGPHPRIGIGAGSGSNGALAGMAQHVGAAVANGRRWHAVAGGMVDDHVHVDGIDKVVEAIVLQQDARIVATAARSALHGVVVAVDVAVSVADLGLSAAG
mmetsp:Transcript_21804/g.60565  ORF Transcript_21804/g.60565 Transcript_21804/m.60565 type:complete len:275 (-) Transcript_21804:681-1505(-)